MAAKSLEEKVDELLHLTRVHSLQLTLTIKGLQLIMQDLGIRGELKKIGEDLDETLQNGGGPDSARGMDSAGG